MKSTDEKNCIGNLLYFFYRLPTYLLSPHNFIKFLIFWIKTAKAVIFSLKLLDIWWLNFKFIYSANRWRRKLFLIFFFFRWENLLFKIIHLVSKFLKLIRSTGIYWGRFFAFLKLFKGVFFRRQWDLLWIEIDRRVNMDGREETCWFFLFELFFQLSYLILDFIDITVIFILLIIPILMTFLEVFELNNFTLDIFDFWKVLVFILLLLFLFYITMEVFDLRF
mgnify:CR=1 FL=1